MFVFKKAFANKTINTCLKYQSLNLIFFLFNDQIFVRFHVLSSLEFMMNERVKHLILRISVTLFFRLLENLENLKLSKKLL